MSTSVHVCVCVYVYTRGQALYVFVCKVLGKGRRAAQCVGQGVSLMRLYGCGMRVTHTDDGLGNI